MRYLMAAEMKYHKPEAKAEKAWWEDWIARRRKARGEDASVVYLTPASYTTQTYVA
jgi:allantoicase